MTVSFEWVFALLFGGTLTVFGWYVIAQSKRNSEIDGELNAIRAELNAVRRDYVRRDDMNGSISGIRTDMAEMKTDIKEVSGMMVKLLMAYGKPPP